MRQARITLSGYYGFGNAGDEAVLAGLVKAFRARRTAQELQITALSMRPGETRQIHGIESAHRYRAPELLRSLLKTDALLSGGGSLLQDVTSAHGIFYYAGVVRMAQLLGKKTMFIAQGVGPLVRPRSRKLVAAVANRLDAITVRDSGSAALLREVGVTRIPIAVTADPALLLSPPQSASREQEGFAVALRSWTEHGLGLPEMTARACGAAFGDSRSALGIAMQPKSDLAVTEQFAQLWHQMNGKPAKVFSPVLPGTDTVDLEAALRSIAECRIVVGMRLHALILAAACGVPCAALSYDPKVAAFMESCGQGDAVYDLKENDSERLTALLRQVWAEREQRAAALQSLLPKLHADAGRNADIALALLK